MKKNLQRFGASVLAAAMVAQSVALPAAAETTKIDSSVAQSVAASAASAASAVQSLPKFTSTADLIKQTAQTLAAQGEVHELEQDDAKLEATAQSKAGMSFQRWKMHWPMPCTPTPQPARSTPKPMA